MLGDLWMAVGGDNILPLLSALTLSHLCSVRWQCSASAPNMFVADSGWLLIHC